MTRTGARRVGAGLVLLSGLQAGCAGLSGTEREPDLPYAAPKPPAVRRDLAPPDAPPPIKLTSATAEDTAPAKLPPAQLPAPAPLTGTAELSVDVLVEQVVARNPTVAQMVAAWQAASARYPQVTSLDDPLVGTTLAPGTIGSRADGYRFEVFQRFQYPGKLHLRGQVALAEASAVGRDVENARQQLVESARDAFYEYYLIARGTEVNEEVLRLLADSRKTAETLYKTGRVKQQDILVLDVEIGRQKNRSILLDRQRRVAVARINTLLHLPPDSDLPPPPKDVKVEDELPDPKSLRDQALAQRLDLLALADRIKAAKASLDLARREYYPDFDVMGAYDSFWDNSGQRLQAGVRINLPVRLTRRDAAVAEAQARLAELQAQLARQQDVAGFEVRQAYEQWRESLRTVRLIEADVLPAARLSVKSAQTGYQTGDVSLLVLLETQRNLADLQDQYYAATADFFRRRTVLQRALTGTPSTAPLPMPAERPSPGQPGSPTGLGR